MGSGVLSKSWLFEIVDTRANVIAASFTLVIPPNAVSIKEKQRVSITKTFDNAFIDDYGPDNLEIIIKGISGTAHVFPTFRTVGYSTEKGLSLRASLAEITSFVGYRHKEAFYEFRDTIMRYKDLFGIDNFELWAYDLADEQAYNCILIDFSVDRTASTPFYYPYTINLFVYEKLGSKTFRPKIVNFSDNVNAALSAIESGINFVSGLFDFVDDVLNAVTAISTASDILRKRLGTFSERVNTLLASPLILTKRLMDAIDNASKVLDDAKEKSRISEIYHAYGKESFQEMYRKALGIYGNSISQGSQTTRTEYIPVDNGLNIDPTLPATAPNAISRKVLLESYGFSGLRVYIVKGEDTLQRIALNETGSIDNWRIIALINGMASNSDLIVGSGIYIPVPRDLSSVNKDAYIITEDVARDPYGSDIKVDSNGNLVVLESNDVSLVSGIENVKQAVDLILNTLNGSLVVHSAYGLIAQPGVAGEEIALKYLRMNIINALMKDPRISKVGNINLRFDSDVIRISMNINVVGYDTTIPVDTIL